MSSAATSDRLPRHEDLVNERLVRWWFLAALLYIGRRFAVHREVAMATDPTLP